MDRLDGLAAQPIAWQRTAATYVVAANYLLRMDAPPAGWEFTDSGSNAPVLLLFATAAENLLKAIRVAQGDRPVVVDGRLAEYYGTHRLLQYADDAQVPLSEAERSLLVHLEHVLEAGKYPVAKARGKSSQAWSYLYRSDVEPIWALLQKLDTELRRTGATCLPAYDVAKLQAPE